MARSVVVGVLPEQPLWVLQVAGEYAQAFDAELVCVAVDAARYAFQELPDGSLMTAPLDPDRLGSGPLVEDARLRDIGAVLDPRGVRWSLRELAGAAADGIDAVAQEVGALMIVVGARRGGLRSVLSRSTASRLTHRQYRPVVVVPTDPEETDEALLGR